MKRIVALLMVFLFLGGCGSAPKPIDKAMLLRTKLLQSNGCDFKAIITADYFDKLQVFKLHCRCDAGGNLKFEVLEPSTISGVTGEVNAQNGKLTFDENALLFPLMAENRISPVSAPWIVLEAFRSGYIRGCTETDDTLTTHIDDTLAQNTLQVILLSNLEEKLISAEIFYHERRILTVQIEDFAFL